MHNIDTPVSTATLRFTCHWHSLLF